MHRPWNAVCLALCLATSVAAGDAPKNVGSTIVPVNIGDRPLMIWSGGAFIFVDYPHSEAPVFRVFDRDGRESRFPFTIPGGSMINLGSNRFARGHDGTIAAVGTVSIGNGGGPFLAWIYPDGREQKIVQLPLVGQAVAVGADGSAWIAVRDQGAADHDVIRRYYQAGKAIGSSIPRSSLPVMKGPGGPAERSALFASRDRIGWYAPAAQSYIEFTLDGKIAARFSSVVDEERKNKQVHGFALCDDGEVFGSAQLHSSNGAVSGWGIYRLDRARNTWVFTPRSEKSGRLAGCDGTRVAALTEASPASATFTWLDRARN